MNRADGPGSQHALGVQRGLGCLNDRPLDFDLPLVGPPHNPYVCEFDPDFFGPGFSNSFLASHGDFVPYSDPRPVDPNDEGDLDAPKRGLIENGDLARLGLPNPCAPYNTYRAYVRAVRRGARYAAEKRWILQDDIDDIVELAKSRAQAYPGCVPAPRAADRDYRGDD